MPVFGLARHALDEDDHAADDLCPLRGGDVVALDACRGLGEAQRLLEFRQRLLVLVGVGLPLGAQGR